MKVLIADDSKVIRERIIKLLSSFKEIEKIDESKNVKGTIECIRKELPSVVVLDIQLTDGTGIDVLREIENDEFFPTVMVLTNYNYSTYRTECILYGAKFFFDKSKDFKKVRDTFKELIDKELRKTS